MARNEVELGIHVDTSQAVAGFDKIGDAAKGMAADLERAEANASTFGTTFDAAGQAVGNQEGKFMGAADLLDGLGGAFGLPTDGATGMLRAFGDLSGGLESVQSTMGAVSGFMSGPLNSAMKTIGNHPLLFAIGALAAAFIAAYTQSETFRNIVNGVFTGIWTVFQATFGLILEAVKAPFTWVMDNWEKLTTVMEAPFKAAAVAVDGIVTAFKEVWNKVANFISDIDYTVDIPDWLPGPDEVTIGLPDMPTFKHMGGMVPGNPGQTVPIMALAGERILRPGEAAGGTTVVVNFNGVVGDPAAAARQIDSILRQARNRGVIPAA